MLECCSEGSVEWDHARVSSQGLWMGRLGGIQSRCSRDPGLWRGEGCRHCCVWEFGGMKIEQLPFFFNEVCAEGGHLKVS